MHYTYQNAKTIAITGANLRVGREHIVVNQPTVVVEIMKSDNQNRWIGQCRPADAAF